MVYLMDYSVAATQRRWLVLAVVWRIVLKLADDLNCRHIQQGRFSKKNTVSGATWAVTLFGDWRANRRWNVGMTAVVCAV